MQQEDLEVASEQASQDKTADPGDAQNVPVPDEHAAEGSSEQFAAVEGIQVPTTETEPEEPNRGGRTF
jgi:hypothetical protein